MGSKTVETETVEGYRLFGMGIFSKLVGDLLCPDCCDSQLYVSTDISKRKGLASHVSMKCTCGYTRSEYTSTIIQKQGKGVKAFDVNMRIVYAMRSCGPGYNALERFCGLMNVPPPVTPKIIML